MPTPLKESNGSASKNQDLTTSTYLQWKGGKRQKVINGSLASILSSSLKRQTALAQSVQL